MVDLAEVAPRVRRLRRVARTVDTGDAMIVPMPTHDAQAFASVFRPVRSATAFEETMERILRSVALGVVKQGERLPGERELAAMLHVSRATLREALDALREVGIVESRRGRTGGSFVARMPLVGDLVDPLEPVTAARVEDVLTFRLAVEVGAAEAAANRALTPEARVRLEDALALSLSAPIEAYRAADSRLHLAFAEASGSSHLVATVAEAELELHKLLDVTPVIASKLRHSNVQHEAIVGAILASDATGARGAVERHLDATAALVRGFYGFEDRASAPTGRRPARRAPGAVGAGSGARRRAQAEVAR